MAPFKDMVFFCTWSSEKVNNFKWINGALHTGLKSGSDADLGSRLKENFASTRPWSGSERRVLCCVIMCEIQSSSAMCVVWAPCGAHARPHWIWIGDLDPVNPVSVPVWRAPLLNLIMIKVFCSFIWKRRSLWGSYLWKVNLDWNINSLPITFNDWQY